MSIHKQENVCKLTGRLKGGKIYRYLKAKINIKNSRKQQGRIRMKEKNIADQGTRQIVQSNCNNAGSKVHLIFV